ncbi:hypothetical protein LJC19_06110 [Oxalobacter sp. OttesenSCG-928-P03]|nr:hypothetical protein [Oxalobacter sp. OttesenSCG-928-P03]
MPVNIDEMAGTIRAMRATLLSLIETHPQKSELQKRLKIARESEFSMMLNERVEDVYIAAFERTMAFYEAASEELK